MRHIWTSCETSIPWQLVLLCHKDSEKFKLGREARQRDNIFPKLFTSCLQYAIIYKNNWENKGIRINGEYLSYLIFANDIVLIANSTSTLQETIQDILDISKPVGLKMYLGNTKVMCNKHVNKDDVIVDMKTIEEVDRYVYLGQMVAKNHDQVQEMKKNRIWVECILQGGQPHGRQKYAIQWVYTPSNEIRLAVRPYRSATPNLRNWSQTKRKWRESW